MTIAHVHIETSYREERSNISKKTPIYKNTCKMFRSYLTYVRNSFTWSAYRYQKYSEVVFVQGTDYLWNAVPNLCGHITINRLKYGPRIFRGMGWISAFVKLRWPNSVGNSTGRRLSRQLDTAIAPLRVSSFLALAADKDQTQMNYHERFCLLWASLFAKSRS